ncbi:uncharacterized protein PHACADRAFT_26077 [Phanerochaete carnosa HHB-10118-sp]|uniref:Uncharacterized protein n=1 Tax=Phanerochaete carnosa (strain HHB-10118-sp) TaxID=650164 RepID=K5WLI9_PHACS|nr:uncharacterized protein PHACADRAFT_26077 [Phanerochaete carnosa HHB-10118-sp]EKM60054.1 hypothetical protein PHACADRAFT_26077 [Phanerochaete carnosa HHB-10118-sp]
MLQRYHALSDKEKTKCIYDYELMHKFKKRIGRTTSQGKIQDFSHTTAILEEIILDLDNRIGVKGFFCLVRSITESAIKLRWWFSSADLKRFLSIGWHKWCDSKQIGMMVEAFTIAGSFVLGASQYHTGTNAATRANSLIGVLRTNKLNAEFTKAQIWDKMKDLLGQSQLTITYILVTDSRASSRYYQKHFSRHGIIQRYGVVLVSWPKDLSFVNPSDLTNNLTTLELLLQALNNGTCHFICPTDAKLSQRKAAWLAGIANGTVEAPKQRKKRSNAGKP